MAEPAAEQMPNGHAAGAAASAKSKAELARMERNRKKKQHRKQAKRQQKSAGADGADAGADARDAAGAPAAAADAADTSAVAVEYVSKRDEVASDPAFEEFSKVFERFSTAEELLGAKPAADDEREDGDGADEAGGRAEHEGADGDGADGEAAPSKRKLRKELRLTVAELKRSVARPEVIEQWDISAPDPLLLAHLKAYRNVVPVPRHWSQKRAYLQGKRGVEKKPFQLPEFIAATGIEKIRQAVAEKDDAKKLKQKARESMRPKMSRVDLDYQVLHDAFFKYQTKPKMSGHGDLYYEGKESETHLRELRPGKLSADARQALGMGDDPLTPTPWLVNMQRYGPPPSFPNLRIPGLNAPLPEGASYGHHPGGWGKPPVDENGAPLYGDPFGAPTPLPAHGGMNGAPPPPALGVGAGLVDADGLWGEPDADDSDSEDESDAELDGANGAASLSDAEVARGISSTVTTDTGVATPASIHLRKERQAGIDTPGSGADTPAHGAAALGAPDAPPRALYTVLEQQATSVGAATFGSTHTYALPPAGGAAGRAKQPAGARGGDVQVALDPSELEHLDEATLKARYDATLAAAKREREAGREDLSGMVEEHEARKRRKQQAQGQSGGDGRK